MSSKPLVRLASQSCSPQLGEMTLRVNETNDPLRGHRSPGSLHKAPVEIRSQSIEHRTVNSGTEHLNDPGLFGSLIEKLFQRGRVGQYLGLLNPLDRFGRFVHQLPPGVELGEHAGLVPVGAHPGRVADL